MPKTFFLSCLLMASAIHCTSVTSGSWVVEQMERDLASEPVFVTVPAADYPEGVICLSSSKGMQPAQVEHIDRQNARIWWIVTQTAGEAVRYVHKPDAECGQSGFSWKEAGSRSLRLELAGKPVIQYEHPVFDPDDIEHTKKPFHHVYNPAGERLITKGPGGRFSHHRGIFLGFYVFLDGSDQRIDIWHARNGERSEHNRVIRKMEGPVMGGHVLAIDWKDLDGDKFIEEIREVRTFRQPQGHLLIDVRSELTALRDKVLLGGDRHHAGLQFRAAQEVADDSEATRFIRPEPWSDLAPDVELGSENILDFPWNAMFFEVGGQTYTVSYMSHPSNPDGAEMSERLYGRFGEFFSRELSRGETLVMNYRFWITEGEAPDRSGIQHRYENYVYFPKIVP